MPRTLTTPTKSETARTPPLTDARGVTALDGTTKARIERAAISLFVTHGVGATTTREITADAGVAEGTLYRHFTGKDDLAESAFFSVHHRLAELIETAGESAADVEGQARAVVSALVTFADADWTLFQYHLLHTHHFLPRRDEAKNPVTASENLVRAAMARGEIPDGDAIVVAAMALGVVQQAALHKAYGRIVGDLAVHIPAFEAAVIAVLKSQPSA